jgi:brefeldin A-inhibited guanine nucleotide-exchange protein
LSDQFYSASHFLGEMKAKNMGAIKVLLDVAVNEGNNFKGS